MQVQQQPQPSAGYNAGTMQLLMVGRTAEPRVAADMLAEAVLRILYSKIVAAAGQIADVAVAGQIADVAVLLLGGFLRRSVAASGPD